MEEIPEYYREDDGGGGGDEEVEEEDGGGGKELYEFQPLPTLLEDEENVSLADILSLRDGALAEQDLWAICLECCYSMQDITHSAIFQTLCITPDTLAFNTSGNVCFMEQLSDDPEGAFVPPEFDLTGNTLEAHIYSLGATLKAAVEFVVSPDSQAEFSQDLTSMLDCMQQENPSDRPDIQSIISLCEEKLDGPSASLCRSLSSIGRRVLSIESVSAVQDGWESLWKGMNKKDNGVKDLTPNHFLSSSAGLLHHSTSSHEDDFRGGWREADFRIEKPCPSPNSFGHHLKKSKRTKPSFEKFETFDRFKVEDEIAKLSLKIHRRNKNSPVGSPVDKSALARSPPNGEMATLKSWPSVPSCLSPNQSMDNQVNGGNRQAGQTKHVSFANAGLPSPNNINGVSPLGQSKCHSQVSYENLVMALEQESQQMVLEDEEQPQKFAKSEYIVPVFAPLGKTQPDQLEASSGLYYEDDLGASGLINCPDLDPDFREDGEAHALLEDQQWISLRDILINYEKPLQEDELWSLCHECLYTLSTYVDYPAILCLESVLLNQNGEVLFVTNGDEESFDAFCVPPEYDADGDAVGTEKGCVYGIAAILWSAAKFNFPANHKLALPKKLKRFLLQMAKRDAEERPGLEESLQFCRKFLLQKNLDSKAVWSHLISRTQQIMQDRPPSEMQPPQESDSSSGFVPVAVHSKLMAVRGPVPMADLPAAFTSPATYFKPIVLLQNADTGSSGTSSHPPIIKSSVTPAEDPRMIPEDIGVLEMRAGDEAARQCLRSSSGSSPAPYDRRSSLPEIPSDRKDKIPSAASSIYSDSSTLISSPIINNYILKQDPKTGNLTLVRVHLSIPDNIPAVSLGAGPAENGAAPNGPAVDSTYEDHAADKPLPSAETCSNVPDYAGDITGAPDGEPDQTRNNQSRDLSPEPAVNGESPIRRAASTPLQKVVQLLRDEFAFDGYLENGVEDVAMGEYIFSLKGLQQATFCNAICEKFCDLYWEENLLQNLYKIISGKSPPPARKPMVSSPPGNSPARLLKKVQKKGRKHRKHGKPSASDQKSPATGQAPANSMQAAPHPEALPHPPPHPEQEEAPVVSSVTGSETQLSAVPEEGAPCDDTNGTEGTDPPPQSPEAPAENDEDSEYRVFSNCNSLCGSPDLNDEGDEEFLTNQSVSMSVSPAEVYRCGSGWSTAFYGPELFDPDVQHYVSILGRPKEKCAKSIEEKRLELEQQLMIETKNYRKTIKLYQNLIQKGKRNKGSEGKELLPKLKGNLEEMKSKVQFLELAKKLLQVSYAEQWGVEPRDLPTVGNLACQERLNSSPEDPAFLIYNDKGHRRDNTSRNLQAGTPLGLLTYLYCRNSVLDGFVQQFLYTFRYVCSQEEMLQFLIDRIYSTVPREDADSSSSLNTKIFHRSLLLLQTWIEDCGHIDFSTNQNLLDKLEDLYHSQSLPKDERGDHLLCLLQEMSNRKSTLSSSGSGSDKRDDTRSLHSLCSKFSEDTISRKSFNWKLSRGNGLHVAHQRDKQYNISSALPRPCYPGVGEELSSYYVRGDEGGPHPIHNCSVQQISTQLTLLQEEMFQKCHPVHFLNSRALGVKDKTSQLAKMFSSEAPAAEASSLFSPGATHDKYLLQMLRFADNVSTWVAAEVVTCHTAKLQAGVLTKFLLVAKLCYEQQDFASSVQILWGLEHLIVRQLPAWKNIPSKVSEILEELKAVEVFLKSDGLCLMKGDRFRTLPTIPSAHLLAMHIQQLETGGFTMANGAFKWNKLRNIAKVISQVHAFQEIPYSFAPDADFQFHLRQRILQFSDADISLLAADNNANFHHVNSGKNSRKIQDTLRRMKATFQ